MEVDDAPRSSSLLATVLAVVICAAAGGVIALALRARSDEAQLPTKAPATAAAWQRQESTAPGGRVDPRCGALDPEIPSALTLELPDGDGREPTVSFGVVRQAIQETKRVPFRSTGEGPLCIYKLTSACSCYRLQLEDPAKRRYEPGEGGALLITLDSTGHVGTVAKKVMIHTNARRAPTRVVTCRASVGTGLMLMERSARFPPVPSGTPSEVVLTLYAPKSEAPFEVTGIEVGRAGPDGSKATYEVETTPVDDPLHHKLAVRITAPGRTTSGAWRDELLIATSYPDRPHVAVRAFGQVVDRIVTRTQQVSLGHVGADRQLAPAIVRFHPGGAGISFRLVSAAIEARAGEAPPTGGLGFEAQVDQDHEGWLVRVSYDGKARAPGALQAVLVVRTDDAQQPELRLPVRATVRH